MNPVDNEKAKGASKHFKVNIGFCTRCSVGKANKYSLVLVFKGNCWIYPSHIPTNNNSAAKTKINFIVDSCGVSQRTALLQTSSDFYWLWRYVTLYKADKHFRQTVKSLKLNLDWSICIKSKNIVDRHSLGATVGRENGTDTKNGSCEGGFVICCSDGKIKEVRGMDTLSFFPGTFTFLVHE